MSWWRHDPKRYSKGITCRCEDCEKEFQLTADDDKTEGTAHIGVSSCPSGGVYSVTVTCPHCQYIHELW